MKKVVSVLLAGIMLLCFASCEKTADVAAGSVNASRSALPESMNVYILTGPTGIGAVNMWNDSDSGDTAIKYNCNAAAAPDEVVAKISNGEADVAAVSTNLAAKLYKKTGGKIKVLAVNTLGVLSVLDNTGAEIKSLSDLKGRKIITTGQGSNPQYIIEYLLKKNGIDVNKDVTVEYKAEGTELVSVWGAEPDAVIIAPSPVSTSILMKFEGSKKVLDLTDEWEKCSPDSALMMGCIIARSDFCEQYPEAVGTFLDEYEGSIKAAQKDPQNTGALCEKYGVVAKAAIASKALPDCHICFVTGEEMKNGLTGYLKVLFEADPASVGGMPDDGFWYMGK